MEGFYPKTPYPVSEPVGQAEAAISAQLVAVKSDSQWGLGGTPYSRIVQVLLYAAAVLVPLFYLPWTSSVLEYNKQLLLLVFSAVGLVTWLLGTVVSGKLTVRTTPVDKGMLGILVATIVAAVLSMARAKSIFGLSVSLSSSLLTVAALTVFYFLVVNVVQDRGRMLRTLLSLSVAVALLVGVCQMFSWNFLPGAFTNSRAFNTVGSLNVLGVLAAAFLPLYAKSLLRNARWSSLVLPAVGLALSLVVLAILNWWVLWAIALAGMLGIIAFDSLNAGQLAQDYGGRNRFALSRFVVPMVVVVVGAFLLLVNFNPSSLKSQFPVEVAPSHGLSVQVVKGVLGQNLLFGWGPENFSLAFDRFGAGQLANTQLADFRFYDATSEAYNLAVHGGILALLAFLLLIWCLVQVVARFGGALAESVARGTGAQFAAESSGTLAAALAMLVAFFLYPFNIVLWFAFVALLALAGLAVAGAQQRTVDIEERPMWSLTASLGFIVGLIVVLTALYFTSVRYLADVRYATALAADTPAAAMDTMVRAIDLDSANDRYLRDASQLALAMLSEELNTEDADDEQKTARIQNLLASSIQLAQRAVQVQPDESLNWANLGSVYQSMTGLVDDVERLAEDSYRKASELRPGDPTFDNRIGQMWLSRADIISSVLQQSGGSAELRTQAQDALGKAEESFKQAIEKSSTYGLAIYNLGAVYDRQGKVDEAIKQLEIIAPYNANEPSLMLELGLLYLRAGNKTNAQAAMQRAVLLAPDYANARWYLALLLEDAGDIEAALVQLREIEKNNPDSEVLKQKIQQLTAVPPVPAEGEVIETEPLQ